MAEKVDGRLCDYGSSMDESGDEYKRIHNSEQMENRIDSPKNSSTCESDDQKLTQEESPNVESKLPRQYRKASRSSSHEQSSSDRSKHGSGSRRHRRSSSRSHGSHRRRERSLERRHRHRRRRRGSHNDLSHRRRRRRSPSSSSSSTSASRRDRQRSTRRERDRDTGFSRKIIGSRSELAKVKESVRPVDPVAARLEAVNKASAIMASVKPGESNPQEVLARFQETQMAQVRAKAEAAAVAANLPSFYNPMSVNAAKLAEQQQKRKLLWSRKAVDPSKEAKEEAKSTMWKTTSMVAGKGDSAAAAKFCKLMGIHDTVNPNGKTAPSNEALNQAREQADLFRKLEHEYEQSRTLTHTQRGVGLGYSSAMTDLSAYNAMKQAGGGAPTKHEDE